MMWGSKRLFIALLILIYPLNALAQKCNFELELLNYDPNKLTVSPKVCYAYTSGSNTIKNCVSQNLTATFKRKVPLPCNSKFRILLEDLSGQLKAASTTSSTLILKNADNINNKIEPAIISTNTATNELKLIDFIPASYKNSGLASGLTSNQTLIAVDFESSVQTSPNYNDWLKFQYNDLLFKITITGLTFEYSELSVLVDLLTTVTNMQSRYASYMWNGSLVSDWEFTDSYGDPGITLNIPDNASIHTFCGIIGGKRDQNSFASIRMNQFNENHLRVWVKNEFFQNGDIFATNNDISCPSCPVGDPDCRVVCPLFVNYMSGFFNTDYINQGGNIVPTNDNFVMVSDPPGTTLTPTNFYKLCMRNLDLYEGSGFRYPIPMGDYVLIVTASHDHGGNPSQHPGFPIITTRNLPDQAGPYAVVCSSIFNVPCQTIHPQFGIGPYALKWIIEKIQLLTIAGGTKATHNVY